MKAFLAFSKKEWMESIRSYRLMIMGLVFLLLGMMNPLTAKFTPDIIKNFMPEGMSLTIPESTALDSWVQFYKNIPQMGLIVTVIIFSGLMSNELSRGTLINMLTKGLPRKTVILSKSTVAGLIWTAAYWFCFLVSYVYTAYIWNSNEIPNLIFSVFCLWLFGILLIAIIIFGSVLFKNSYGSLLFTGFFVSVLMLLNLIPKVKEYNPIILSSNNMDLLNGKMVCSDFSIAISISVILIATFLVSSILIFNKKQI